MKKQLKTEIVHGTGIGERCAVGHLRFLHTDTQKKDEKGCGIEEERARLYDAITCVIENLERLQESARLSIGEEAAEIFAIHAMLLEDEDLLQRMDQVLEDGFSAETAVRSAGDAF